MPLRSPALLALGLVAAMSGARAQDQVSPQELHDCTTLTNPGRLEQCIVTGQGAPRIRGRLTSPKAPTPNAPIFKDTETPAKTLTPLPGAP